MIRPICKDTLLLSQKAAPATAGDLDVARDLADTLRAHHDECVGMAANMIGVPLRIIAIAPGPMVLLMLNPVITERSDRYRTDEGCLSLAGTRPAVRYRRITVSWQDEMLQFRSMRFDGFAAQIIQHEMDHLEGILI